MPKKAKSLSSADKGPKRESAYFSQQFYKDSQTTTWCMFCARELCCVKPYRSRNTIGMTAWCAYCKTRVFLCNEDAGIAAEAYRRIFADPISGEALRALLLAEIENIKAEEGLA